MPRVRTDFHNHIIYNRELDGADLSLFVETAHVRLGQGGYVGVVDYHGLDGNARDQKFEIFRERLRRTNYQPKMIGGSALWIPNYNLTFARVIESEATQGDVLTIGLDIGTEVPTSRDLSLDSALEQIRRENPSAPTVLDHLFGKMGTGPYVEKNEHLLRGNLVTGLEIRNRLAIGFPLQLRWRPNKKGTTYYEGLLERKPDLEVGATYGTDGYYETDVGAFWNFLDLPHPEEITDSDHLRTELQRAISSNREIEGKAGMPSHWGVLHHGFDMIRNQGILDVLKELALNK